jgi:predicted DNA-binding protein
MAELIHTICFRVSPATKERLLEIVAQENRRLADVVRLIVEQWLDQDDRLNPHG